MSQPIHHLIDINNLQISAYEWNPECRRQQPTLVLVHATGFHARCWDQVIKQLPDWHIIAVDQRAHGLSSNTSFDSWNDFGEDLAAALEAMGVENAFGVGHSMGGHAATMAASLKPGLFAGLMLIDPVVMSKEFYDFWDASVLEGEPNHPAVKRRNDFTSVEEAIERYRDRHPYAIFDPQALDDYFRFGLHDAEEGLLLACPPMLEARVYDSALSNAAIYDAVHSIQQPVTVVRAMQPPNMEALMKDFRYSPTWPELAGEFANGRDILLQDLTHFMPMQAPKRVAELIVECCAG